MFVLLTIKDTIPVPAKASQLDTKVTIMDAINKKYANKLIPDRGLGIGCWDLLTAEDGKITWGNGMMYYKTSFRLIVFAPFNEEVILARVIESTKQYIRHFFSDIYITKDLMPQNSMWDPKESEWFWYQDNDAEEDEDGNAIVLSPTDLANTPIAQRYYVQKGHGVKVKVQRTVWEDLRPMPPGAKRAAAAAAGRIYSEAAEKEMEKTSFEKAPFKIIASGDASGLLVMQWWE